MERPPSQLKETSDEGEARRPHGQQPRRNSLTPSMRRERPMLRSSPLAGASYSTDGAGNVVEHTSALEEEIARRRTMQLGLNDEDLTRLANLSPSASTPALSLSSSPAPSRKGSLETTEDLQAPRRARPSFISLGPQGSRPGSRDSLVPPTPTSPTLRARHSSPHLAATNPKPKPESDPANWMTAAPAPSFSRMATHGSGVILPVKASSRAGEQIRQRSAPNYPTAKPDMQSQSSTKPRSLRSFRSMSRLLRGSDTTEHEKVVPPMPASISPPGPRSRASSFEVGVNGAYMPSSPVSPITPNNSANGHTDGRSGPIHTPAIADSDAESSRFSKDAEAMGIPKHQVQLGEKEKENRVKRLLTKVRKWRAQS